MSASRPNGGGAGEAAAGTGTTGAGDGVAAARERIAARAALEVFPGARLNLGIGLPTRIPDHLPADLPVWIHSENGFLGMGPAAAPGREDPDLIDAGGRYVTLRPGAAFFDSVTSFALVRSGRIDLCFLGAFEVDVRGDLANWRIPGRAAPGVGGAMELAQRVPRVIVTTLHVDRRGGPKLRSACSLPRTARGSVTRIVTDLAVLEPAGAAFRVLEIAPGVDEARLRDATDAPLLLDDVRPWRTTRDDAAPGDDGAAGGSGGRRGAPSGTGAAREEGAPGEDATAPRDPTGTRGG